MSKRVVITLSDTDAAALAKNAEHSRMPLGTYLRSLLVAYLEGVMQIKPMGE